MATNRAYLAESEVIVHVWNEGVRKEQLFRSNEDYELFLQLLLRARTLTGVSVLLYTLTPYRFDLVLLQHVPYTVSAFMKYVSNNFSRLVNQRLGRKGHSFLRRYSGQPVADASELLILSIDLHVKAAEGLAKTPEAWSFSSCGSYVNGDGSSIVDRSFLWTLTGGKEKYKTLLEKFNHTDPGSVFDYLCTQSEMIWGNKGRRDRCDTKG